MALFLMLPSPLPRRGRIVIAWDGEVRLEAEDSTLARGKLGLWTKADSTSRFDDLEATAD